MAIGPKTVMVIGVVLLIVGLVSGIGGFVSSIKDPSKEATNTLEFSGSAGTKTVSLDAGSHDIWYESGSTFLSLTPVVTITDSGGKVVYSSVTSHSTETISVNGKSYVKLGSFTIDSAGQYNVTAVGTATLYITPPMSVASGIGICFVGVFIGIVGGILILVGVFLHFSRKKAQQAPQYAGQYPSQYPGQYPSQPPGQYYPTQPPGQYPPQQPPPQ